MSPTPPARRNLQSRDRGFTLVELLVVVIVVGVLASVAVPVFLNQRDKAAKGATKATMRNLITEIHGARENTRQALLGVTGNACSACTCASDPAPPMRADDPAFPGTPCFNSWTNAATKLSAASGTSLSAMKALLTDGWGYPLLPDENEGETALCGISTDLLWSGGANHEMVLYPKDADDFSMTIPAGGCSY